MGEISLDDKNICGCFKLKIVKFVYFLIMIWIVFYFLLL